MLSRLGLVIHWLGFAAGLAMTTAVVQYWLWIEDYTSTRGLFGKIIWDYDLFNTQVNSPAVLLICFIGWPVNFIIAGHKSPLPWVANKETEQ